MAFVCDDGHVGHDFGDPESRASRHTAIHAKQDELLKAVRGADNEAAQIDARDAEDVEDEPE